MSLFNKGDEKISKAFKAAIEAAGLLDDRNKVDHQQSNTEGSHQQQQVSQRTKAQQATIPNPGLNVEALDFIPRLEGSDELPDGGDITDPNEWPTVAELVKRLVDPSAQAFASHHHHQGIIKIQLTWVKKTIGEPHFVNNPKIGRSQLKEQSKVRKYGLPAGLPVGYYNWLCGVEIPQEVESGMDLGRMDLSVFSTTETAFWGQIPWELRPQRMQKQMPHQPVYQ